MEKRRNSHGLKSCRFFTFSKNFIFRPSTYNLGILSALVEQKLEVFLWAIWNFIWMGDERRGRRKWHFQTRNQQSAVEQKACSILCTREMVSVEAEGSLFIVCVFFQSRVDSRTARWSLVGECHSSVAIKWNEKYFEKFHKSSSLAMGITADLLGNGQKLSFELSALFSSVYKKFFHNYTNSHGSRWVMTSTTR